MVGVAAAFAWSGAVAADDFDGRGQDFGRHDNDGHHGSPQNEARTATPIKHLVVIFNENRSFDHFFATYPNATNPSGEPVFKAARNTPAVNNLAANPYLLNNNGNFTNPANGSDAANPFRLDRTQANTADQGHAYTPEQQAYDNGAADLFPKFTGKGTSGGAGAFGTKGQVMGYFDGNTVTGLWNYAQHFAMSDNAYTDTYGPSTPGAINVIAGQTNGAKVIVGSPAVINDGAGGLTLINDSDPGYDVCSSKTTQFMMTGKNVGDLLNAAHSPGVRSRVASTCKPSTRMAPPAARAALIQPSSAATSPITFRIISGSSTTRRPPIRPTPARVLPRRSATARRRTAERLTPPITTTTSTTSTRR